MREHLGLQHVVRVLSFCPFGLGKLKAVGSELHQPSITLTAWLRRRILGRVCWARSWFLGSDIATVLVRWFLALGSCPVPCSVFGSIPGLCPLDAGSPVKLWQPGIAGAPLGCRMHTALSESHRVRPSASLRRDGSCRSVPYGRFAAFALGQRSAK